VIEGAEVAAAPDEPPHPARVPANNKAKAQPLPAFGPLFKDVLSNLLRMD
jgi:hypothetical protein